MQFKRAVEEARPGAACAVAVNSLFSGFANLGVGGEAQIIIGSAHNQTTAMKNRLGAFILTHWNEEGIDAPGNCLFGICVRKTLFKDIHH